MDSASKIIVDDSLLSDELTSDLESLSKSLDKGMVVTEKHKKKHRKQNTKSNHSAITTAASSNKSRPKTAEDRHAELLSLLSGISHQNTATNQELSSFKKTIGGKIETIENEVTSQSKRVNNVETKIATMENQVNAVIYERELGKQQQLKNNVSIFGIAKSENEDISKIVFDFFTSLNLKFNQNDITAVYRTAGRSIASNIIVKFADFKHKLMAIEAKATKPTSATGDQQNKPIYINNHVTPFFGRLLAAGRVAIKQKVIHSCWIGNDGCLVKINEGDSPRNIKSLAEMERITGSNGLPKASKRSKPDVMSPETNEANKYAKHQ